MSHLDDLAAAVADNELAPEARDRALGHLAGCAECRADVDVQRRMKALLANQPDPEPAPDLLARLRAIPPTVAAESATAASRTGRRRSTPRVARRPVSGRPPRVTPRRVAAGSVSALALALGLAVAVGGGEPGRRVTPPVSTFVDQHTATTARLPLEDPVGTAVLTSFAR